MSNITKIKAQIGLFSHKASALDLQKAIFSLCVCVSVSVSVSVCVCVFFFPTVFLYGHFSVCGEMDGGWGVSGDSTFYKVL